ncbi:MAG: Kynureninase (L-kynurenine hydrolase) [Bathelium mastoideum]|nr:MAG: Kynureninase (L-kynurenine hydrolase) [Bathelium mastoideum]
MANQRDIDHAQSLDEADPLRHLGEEFIIPSKADLKRKTLDSSAEKDQSSIPSTYLCGNSLGLQPRLTSSYLSHYLSTWATKGVYGHFKPVSDTPLPPWLHTDDAVAGGMARLVGAEADEVAVMQTLTANLHLLLATFYRPTKDRYKIIIESKAFPSDHFAIESQIKHHRLDPSDAMICIDPPPGAYTLPTTHVVNTIRHHAASTALVLLPGIQFYTGQFLDMETINREVHALGIPIGWDLAHAVGNVPLELHKWNVDFACWCMYKYMNCGPGCGGGLFVHQRHSAIPAAPSSEPPARANDSAMTNLHATAATSQDDSNRSTPATPFTTLPPTPSEHAQGYINRLSGWWGSAKSSRFQMANAFTPIPGAAGWQVSNPSVLDMTSVQAALAVFAKTDMAALRAKSVRLTGWLEELLRGSAWFIPEHEREEKGRIGTKEGAARGKDRKGFWIITPRQVEQRGAQLSVMLAEGLLDPVMEVLEEEGCVVDERRPNVIRVAPTPLYNTFEDVRRFVVVFEDALEKAVQMRKDTGAKADIGESVMVHGGEKSKGWSEIK